MQAGDGWGSGAQLSGRRCYPACLQDSSWAGQPNSNMAKRGEGKAMKELKDRDSDDFADISACHSSTGASSSGASKDPSPEAVALLSAPLLTGGVQGGISGRTASWNVVLFCPQPSTLNP